MRATRRGFIGGVWALPALGFGGWAGAGEALERFLALSARLTGFPAAALDPALAGDLLDALKAAGEGGSLEDLLEGPGAGSHDGLAAQIIAAWYSGIHPTAEGPAARAFREALVWRALEFAHAPGYCSAELNDWSRPPSGVGVDAKS